MRITKYVFDTITDPHRGTINVTQWCKRDACWDAVKNCTLTLSPGIEAVLADKEETKTAEREAKNDQQLISDLEAQEKVLSLGAAFWISVQNFALAKKIRVAPDQVKALKYAVKIPSQLPSAYQSVQLLALLEEAEANGFRA